MMELEEIPLSEFLGVKEAEGSLFRLGRQAVAQLDLFDDIYSLSWPGQFGVDAHINQAMDVMVEALAGRRPWYEKVSLVVWGGKEPEAARERVYELGRGSIEASGLWDLTRLLEGDVWAFHFEAPPEPDRLAHPGTRPRLFELWADTGNGPVEEREVGAAADYWSGLPSSTMWLIQGTSAPWSELSEDELKAFWETVEKRRVNKLEEDSG